MLQATAQLGKMLNMGRQDETLPILVNLITHLGNAHDAKELYALFLNHKNPMLLDPIMQHGNKEIADDLFNKAISNNQLDATFPNEVLIALSYWQHPSLQKILIDKYQTLFSGHTDWDEHVTVCQALLNYDGANYQQQIREEVDKCLSVSLFNDLIPVLAYQLHDPKLNEQLIVHAEEVASSSCVSGIILSTALAGPSYRDRFKSMIWNESLEATYAAVGNSYYTLMGMHAQKITIAELYQDFLSTSAEHKSSREHQLLVLADLMYTKLHEPVFYPIKGLEKTRESCTSLYQLFFEWKTNPNLDETIIGIIALQAKKDATLREDWLIEKWSNLRELYALKMENELITQYANNQVGS